MPPPSGPRGLARAVVGDLAGLLVPVECAGCGVADVGLCDPCAQLLAGPPWRCEERASRFDRLVGPAVPVWALAECAGAARQAVVAWKDRGRADLGAVFAAALRDAAVHVAGTLGADRVRVVAVPSSAGSRRRRGGNLVDGLAAAVADGLRRGGVDALSLDALRRRPGPDQVGLGARARARNLVGRVRLRPGLRAVLAAERVILVDDVLTTGASLAAARQVLESAGACVVAGLTLAATPRPGARAAAEARPRPPDPGPWGLRTAVTRG